jgi:hypothetical protein
MAEVGAFGARIQRRKTVCLTLLPIIPTTTVLHVSQAATAQGSRDTEHIIQKSKTTRGQRACCGIVDIAACWVHRGRSFDLPSNKAHLCVRLMRWRGETTRLLPECPDYCCYCYYSCRRCYSTITCVQSTRTIVLYCVVPALRARWFLVWRGKCLALGPSRLRYPRLLPSNAHGIWLFQISLFGASAHVSCSFPEERLKTALVRLCKAPSSS